MKLAAATLAYAGVATIGIYAIRASVARGVAWTMTPHYLHGAPGGDGYYLLYPHATSDRRQYIFDRSEPQ